MSSTTQNASIKGTIIGGETSGFISPQSWAKERQLSLSPEAFTLPVATGRNKKKVSGINVNAFTLSPEQSPLKFRSYITLSTQADFSSPLYFDHAFWVSEIFQTSTSPDNFPVQPDRFHIVKSKEGGEILVVAGAVGVAGIMFMSMQ